MKLVEFSVKNYRSIIQKSTIQIKDKTVIIGPNNEGKSNVLRALDVAFKIFELCPNYYNSYQKRFSAVRAFRSLKRLNVFDWDNDYPRSLLNEEEDSEEGNLEPVCFSLSFELDKEEKDFLRKEYEVLFDESTITFYIRLSVPENYLKVENNHISLSLEDSVYVIGSIAERIKICYIGTIRTAFTAYDSIKRLLSFETAIIAESPHYQKLLDDFSALYDDKLKNVSFVLTDLLKGFVPSINQAKIETQDSRRKIGRYDFIDDFVDVLIDDGVNTSLEQKGSGIQSLIALALAHTVSVSMAASRNLILAIEEPEAHLHPQGIHEIKKILFDIAKRNQLIITTHSPLLANTNDISSNIIVSNNIARAAKSIKEIRDTLGIFASDNLMFADNNILVEGLSDERILKRVLSAISSNIDNAFNSGVLKIINCDGCSKISAFVSLMKVYISRYYIILDGDRDGIEEKRRIEKKDPSISGCITTFFALGMQESEIEDFVDPDSYIDKLATTFSLNNLLTLKKALNDTNQKWSDRLSDYGGRNGHPFEDEDIVKAKTIVADAVVEKGISALRTCRRDIFDTLAANINKMLDE